MQTRQIKTPILKNDNWTVDIDGPANSIVLIIAGVNRLFSWPVTLEDFGQVTVSRYHEVLLTRRVKALYLLNQVHGQDYAFKSSWGLLPKNRTYTVAVTIKFGLGPLLHDGFTVNYHSLDRRLKKSVHSKTQLFITSE